jgi:RNA polymerase sigma-70 factor (ECF subfamily)
MNGNNERLIARLRRKDSDAVQEIVDRFAPQIYRLAFGITRSPMEAQDVTQDVFITVIRRIEDFRGKSSIQTWIYRIAVNASLDRVRAIQRRKESMGIDEYLPTFTSEGKIADELVDWSEEPLDHLLSEEALLKIQEGIEALPEELRVALVMKDVEGFPLKEIADILELSLPAVKSRVHRARLALRGILSHYFGEKARQESHEKTG